MFLYKIALNPFLISALLAALSYGPPSLRSQLSEWLHALPFKVTFASIKYGLKIAFGLGLAQHINRALTTWAVRNWRFSAKSGWNWPNEIAVVTGGSSGIGRAITLGLAERGVTVAILDIQEPAADLAALPHVKFFKCQLTSSASVAEVAAQVQESVGPPSILVNNAGAVGKRQSLIETTDEDLNAIVGVNLLTLWYTTRAFLPHMIKQDRGHVVTNASMYSFITRQSRSAYGVTKVGALVFHETLIQELKHMYKTPGVVATVVHPSFVKTPLITEDPVMMEKFKDKKMATPEDVANPVLENIFSGKGGQIVVPSSLSFASSMRGWPIWAQETLRDLFSILF